MRKFINFLEKLFGGMRNSFLRHRIKNKDFTIISRDCLGGYIYHKLGMKFLSPTINLFMNADDFAYFCCYLDEYINNANLEYEKIGNIVGKDFPICLLKPRNKTLPVIEISFNHYDSFEQAKEKWEERSKRINWNNIYVINDLAHDHIECYFKKESIEVFNQVKYKKVVLCTKDLGYNDQFIIKEPKNVDYPFMIRIKNKLTRKQYFEKFNYIKWLNNKF